MIVDKTKARPLVVDSSPEALGVTAGMTLEAAVSRRVDTIIIDSDEPYYQKVFDQLISELLLKSDRVDSTKLGLAYVRIDGLEAMYGSEENVVSSLLNALTHDLNPRIGVGPSKFMSLVAAFQSQGGCSTRAPEDAASFLSSHAVNLIPTSWENKARLRRFGLRTMGQVASLNVGELQEQFGPEGIRIWELCNGIDNRPFVSIKREEAVTEYMSLPYWAVTSYMLLTVLDTLAKRIFAKPEMRSRYAGKATIECNMSNASTWKKTVALKEPAGSPDRMAFAIRSNIDLSELPGLPEDVFLTLSNFTGEKGSPIPLLHDAQDRDRKGEQVQTAERGLQVRMGNTPVLHRTVEIDPNHPLPELRAVLLPIDPSVPTTIQPLKEPVPIAVSEDERKRPTEIRRDNRRIRVAQITDLWKIDMWWLPRPIVRTYYELERTDGRLVTVFRDNQDNSWYQQAY